MAATGYAAVVPPVQSSSSTGSEAPGWRRIRAQLIGLLLATVVVLLWGWQWMNSLPVPLEADNGAFGSPFDVGTSVHIGVFAPAGSEVPLERAEPKLLSGSVPAALAVSVCHRTDGQAAIGSANGPLPSGACERLMPFDGQRLREDDYLLVSVVPLSPGTVTLELLTGVRDGLRRGSKVVELPPIPAE